MLPFLGPAFIACVAYIDPGNFATNIQSGSAYGYTLLWVVVLANLMAMLLQTMSAKLGLATGHNLAEMCHLQFRKPVAYAMWIVSEIRGNGHRPRRDSRRKHCPLLIVWHSPAVHRAHCRCRHISDLAAGAPRVPSLGGDHHRPRRGGCRLLPDRDVLLRPDWGRVVFHAVVPMVGDAQSVFLAVGIIGATVMPHVIYLHSSLTQQRIIPRSEKEARRIFRWSIPDVVLAMGLAGLVNMAMLYMAAATFNAHGHSDVVDLNAAYQTLTPLLGGAASLVFAISLLAAGLSSSVVGTMAGQVIMQGFVGFTIPIWVRRLVTLIPAILVVVVGFNPTQSLVISQVVLSFVLPLPVITLVLFTRRRDIMGTLVNKPITTWAAIVCSVVILSLNIWLL